MSPRSVHPAARLVMLLILATTLTGCGWFGWLRSDTGQSGEYTCSNVSAVGQQYMRASRPEDLSCGEMGEPIRVPAS